MVCIGGPFDGDHLINWQSHGDAVEVYRLVEPCGIRYLSAPPRGRWIWADLLAHSGSEAVDRLGQYRLHPAAGQAVWVPA